MMKFSGNVGLKKFAEYQQNLARQGVLPMLHHLLLAENITEKLLSRPDGERKLTDLLTFS